MCAARGWRLSLAGAAAPALLLFLGSLALPDTPNSLLERGREAEAHRVLARVRTAPYRNLRSNAIIRYGCGAHLCLLGAHEVKGHRA